MLGLCLLGCALIAFCVFSISKYNYDTGAAVLANYILKLLKDGDVEEAKEDLKDIIWKDYTIHDVKKKRFKKDFEDRHLNKEDN